MGFNCLKARATSRRQFTFYHFSQQYFHKHLTEGLYVLQFWKCDDKNCCTIKNDPLPPLIPASVMAPDGEHCLAFDDDSYRIVQTTEKDCPSLSLMVSQKKKDNSNFKFISSHVVVGLESSLCVKLRCFQHEFNNHSWWYIFCVAQSFTQKICTWL